MKLLIACLIICMASTAYGQTPEFNETCETTKYPPAFTTKVGTVKLNLDLPPEERWREIATAYKKPIKDLIDFIKEFVVEFSPKFKKIVDIIDNDMPSIAYTLPAPYNGEIIGIANATGINLGEIVLYNIFYEIFTLCTSIVGEDANGNMLHGRNLDFGLFTGWDIKNDTWKVSELLRPLIINIDNMKDGKLAYKTVTFVGFVGLITAVRPGVVSMSLNERFALEGGYVGIIEWILNTNREQKWPTLLARDIMEAGLNFEDSLNALQKPTLVAPIYYIVGGPEPGQGAVVTRSRRSTVDLWRINDTDTFYIAETNYDHWEKPLFVDDRITPTNVCMKKLGKENFSFAGLFNVLSSKPVLNKLTTYSALIDIKSGNVETYIQDCKTPCWPF